MYNVLSNFWLSTLFTLTRAGRVWERNLNWQMSKKQNVDHGWVWAAVGSKTGHRGQSRSRWEYCGGSAHRRKNISHGVCRKCAFILIGNKQNPTKCFWSPPDIFIVWKFILNESLCSPNDNVADNKHHCMCCVKTWLHPSWNSVLLQGEGLVSPREEGGGQALPFRPRPLHRRGQREGGQVLPAAGAAAAVALSARPGHRDRRVQRQASRRRDWVAPKGLPAEPRGSPNFYHAKQVKSRTWPDFKTSINICVHVTVFPK